MTVFVTRPNRNLEHILDFMSDVAKIEAKMREGLELTKQERNTYKLSLLGTPGGTGTNNLKASLDYFRNGV